jgi:benzoate-CoA ligase
VGVLTLPVAPPPERFNFAQHLLTLNEGWPERLAYIDDFGSLAYGDLAIRIRRCASMLQDAGLRREERVLLLAEDRCEWVIGFLGALYAGIVPVALNTLLPVEDYAYVLDHCGACGAIVSAGMLEKLEAAAALAAHPLDPVFVIGGSDLAMRDFGSALEAAAPAAPPDRTRGDDPAFWLYSSGSTGKPKGVVHTHANLYWTGELYGRNHLGLHAGDRVFSAAKLFFAYGLGNGLTFPLSVGASAVLMAERPTPDAVFRRLIEHRPTLFCGAPTGYAGILASPALPTRDAVNLRLCLSAGEALPAAIGTKFQEHFGCEIIDGIGSTEMLHIFLSNKPGAVRYGSTGRPVPGYEVELRDEAGKPVPDGQVGDLYIHGPSAAIAYWRDRARSRETFIGAWTKSGDKYFRDVDGTYVYAGRSDDMLKVSGQYVSPAEVEGVLMSHPAVLEVGLVGARDTEGLTRATAFVVLKPGAASGPEMARDLQAFVKERLTPHKRPHHIIFMTELPKTATGKIQRFRLRELAAQHA